VCARESVSGELTSEAEGGKTLTSGTGKGAFSISASLSATSTTINYSLLFLYRCKSDGEMMGRGARVLEREWVVGAARPFFSVGFWCLG